MGLETLNPVFRANPFYGVWRKVSKLETQPKIAVEEIESTLDEADEINLKLTLGLSMTHYADKKKVRAFLNKMKDWTTQIRSDLNDTTKFMREDKYYVRL